MGLEAFRKILNHPAFLDKPLILETPRHFPGNRDLGHGLPAEIGRKEDIRLGVEMDFLRTIVDLPQDEWQEKRQALWEQFRKDKRRPENLINNLMNRNRETALYDQFKDERKAMNPLIQSAGQIRRRQREEEDAGEQGREKRPYLQQSATKKGRVDGVSSRVSRRGEKSKCLRKLSRQGDEGQHTTDERDLGSSGRSTRAAAKAAATAITNSWLLTDLTRTPGKRSSLPLHEFRADLCPQIPNSNSSMLRRTPHLHRCPKFVPVDPCPNCSYTQSSHLATTSEVHLLRARPGNQLPRLSTGGTLRRTNTTVPGMDRRDHREHSSRAMIQILKWIKRPSLFHRPRPMTVSPLGAARGRGWKRAKRRGSRRYLWRFRARGDGFEVSVFTVHV